jgi:Fur family ferric uptake transcriptional regulator
MAREEHHDHIVCVSCGKVVEFHDDVIEAQQVKVAELLGFRLTSHALHLYGVCNRPECQLKQNGK